MNKCLKVVAQTDEIGEMEEFTWDLLPVIDPQKTSHLDTNGLPKIGTYIVPGMIVVGKIGKTRDFDSSQQPTSLEIHGLPFNELRSRYGNMWKDTSLYADSKIKGVVKEAYIERERGQLCAVVVLGDEPEKGTVPE